ncbi:MAG: HPr family phosphocarrier protein [Caldicoprobacterales bacterium]|jgi:phosphocarrier protein HPr|nr:HPr family phosphocarrier protein [Clostridiales bacterium]
MEIERKIRLCSLTEVKNFIVVAGKYRCDVKVKASDKIVDGKSMMGIVSLMLSQPLTIIAQGEDADAFAGHLDQVMSRTQQ